MDVTVILCTYNRCHSLKKALESIADQTFPGPLEWEILVVDNNSSDDTRLILADIRLRYPERIRCVFEPKQGLSHARNAAIREARGDILAFTDDDVTVEREWLWNLTAHLRSPEWAGAAGRIIPDWTCPPPRWLRLDGRYALAPFVAFDLGPEALELAEAPYGANVAFRKEMFEEYGDFRTDLGRTGRTLLGGEDTEFGERVLAAGRRLRYEHSAVVYHEVPENRIRKEYLLEWSYFEGLTHFRLFGMRKGTRYTLAGIPLYLFRNLTVWTLRWMLAVKPSWRFDCKRNVWQKAGEIVESYRQSHHGKAKEEASIAG